MFPWTVVIPYLTGGALSGYLSSQLQPAFELFGYLVAIVSEKHPYLDLPSP
jgi:hypothetical protein